MIDHGLAESAKQRRINGQCNGCTSDLDAAKELLREARKWAGRCTCIGAFECVEKINAYLADQAKKGSHEN